MYWVWYFLLIPIWCTFKQADDDLVFRKWPDFLDTATTICWEYFLWKDLSLGSYNLPTSCLVELYACTRSSPDKKFLGTSPWPAGGVYECAGWTGMWDIVGWRRAGASSCRRQLLAPHSPALAFAYFWRWRQRLLALAGTTVKLLSAQFCNAQWNQTARDWQHSSSIFEQNQAFWAKYIIITCFFPLLPSLLLIRPSSLYSILHCHYYIITYKYSNNCSFYTWYYMLITHDSISYYVPFIYYHQVIFT